MWPSKKKTLFCAFIKFCPCVVVFWAGGSQLPYAWKFPLGSNNCQRTASDFISCRQNNAKYVDRMTNLPIAAVKKISFSTFSGNKKTIMHFFSIIKWVLTFFSLAVTYECFLQSSSLSLNTKNHHRDTCFSSFAMFPPLPPIFSPPSVFLQLSFYTTANYFHHFHLSDIYKWG